MSSPEEAVKKAIRTAMNEDSALEVAAQPFRIPVTDNKLLEVYIVQPTDNKTQVFPNLQGLKTWTFLDGLFYTEGTTSVLNGIPVGGQLGITGIPSSGKSILIQEIAIQVAANGKNVLLVTSEDIWKTALRHDLESRCKQKAEILKLDWETIRQHLFVLDMVKNTELREWFEFVKAYKYVVEKKDIALVLIDSVTMLEDYRASIKYRIHEMCNYNQLHGITAIYVNQRASTDTDGYSIAGGIGLAHNLDGIIVIDYDRAYHGNFKLDLNASHQEPVRFVRILGCRLCSFDGHYHRLQVDEKGLLRMVENPPKEEKKK